MITIAVREFSAGMRVQFGLNGVGDACFAADWGGWTVPISIENSNLAPRSLGRRSRCLRGDRRGTWRTRLCRQPLADAGLCGLGQSSRAVRLPSALSLGLVDDRFGLRGRQKLAGQIVAAGILIASGVVINRISLFGVEVELGLLAIPVTVLWLTGAINALNLLDGMDGMATVIGLILSLAICALAIMTNHMAVAVAALVFSVRCSASCSFNLAPAKIYLGDAGSMLIGIVVGCLSMRASVKGAGTVLLAAPLAVMTIPILDSLAAILRRRLAGQSIYAPDRGSSAPSALGPIR